MVRCLALLRPRQTLDSAVFVPLHRLQPVVDDLTDGPDGPAEQVSLCVDRSLVVDDLTDGAGRPANTALDELPVLPARAFRVDVVTERDP